MNHHDINMRSNLRELQPEIGDIRIGDRLFHPGADIIYILDQIIHGKITPQQHFIAHHHARYRVRVSIGLGNTSLYLLGIIRRVGAQPDPQPDLKAGFLG